jgi:hypothetical protein
MSRKTAGRTPEIEQVKAVGAVGGNNDRAEYFDWRSFDPTMLKGGLAAPLAMELVTYRDHLDELLRHKGQYVVIKGNVIAGYYRDRKSAVTAAIARYKSDPVLIKKVVEKEPVRQIGHVTF